MTTMQHRLNVTRYLVRLAGLLITLLAGGAQAALVPYQDGNFADGDWNIWTSGFGSRSGSSTQVLTGGNPDAYRQIDISAYASLGTSSQIYVHHTNQAFSYDPSVSGAITSVDLSFDSKTLSGWNVNILVFAEQGGNQYFLRDASGFIIYTPTTANWTTTLFTGLDAASFGGSRGLDFSELGGPVSFGFSVFGGVGSGSMASSVAFDNWSVTVANASPVPVPAAFWLMASGLLGMTAVARRRVRA